MASSEKRRGWLIVTVALIAGMIGFAALRGSSGVQQDVAPTATVESNASDELPITRDATIEEVMELAEAAKAQMEASLSDYTARFVQQESDTSGKLGEQSEYRLKIQSRMRNESNDAPKRVYLKFIRPESAAGREVIWGADLYDGKMAVHETTVLLSWKILWLDPDGMIAMAGQKYPIYEAGLVRLVEQLIERGQRDIGNPNTTVTVTRNHEFDGQQCELIRVTHAEPNDEPDDFSTAEIVYDPEQLLILSYRAFGWAEPGKDVPLIESYQYYDLKTNVGLTDKDFDVTNPDYGYPK